MRKRLLLSAYSAAPNRGSEPGVGWRTALYAAREFDTWVLCRKQEYEAPIREWLESNGPVPGLTFHFVPMTPFETRLMFIQNEYSYILRYYSYNRWQRRAYRLAAELHRQLRFDVVHHVTWSGFREPGYLWRLDAPFIWGPVGGTQNYPWRFMPAAGLAGGVFEALRMIVNNLQLRHSRRVRQAAQRSAIVLGANSKNVSDIERLLGVAVQRMPDVGVDSVNVNARVTHSSDRPLRILWSGRLDHRKALHLLLVALGGLKNDVRFQLKILGDGPLRRRWQKIAERGGITEHAEWCGRLPYEEALKQYLWADVFVFTSLRDTFGTVVLEALSNGVPVICFDHFGAGDAVTDACGIKIPITTPSDAIQGFKDAITRLADNPGELECLSRGAIQRAGEYLWEEKSKRLMSCYRSAISQATNDQA